ncbi:MAG: pilus assembly protein [Proteobacteria bacterium]|nr:pilus assembly protein [Pseudomonadota bacterium]
MTRPFRAKRRRGAAAVEFAVTFPILLLLTFGIIEYGWMFHEYNQLHTALRDAARAGAKIGATSAETTAETRFQANTFYYGLCGSSFSPCVGTATVNATDGVVNDLPGQSLHMLGRIPYTPVTGFSVPGVPPTLSAEIVFGLEPS